MRRRNTYSGGVDMHDSAAANIGWNVTVWYSSNGKKTVNKEPTTEHFPTLDECYAYVTLCAANPLFLCSRIQK